jgi:hypothetical protein
MALRFIACAPTLAFEGAAFALWAFLDTPEIVRLSDPSLRRALHHRGTFL